MSTMDVDGRILEARSLGGIPPTEPLVPYRNIGDLMEQNADRFEQKAFMVYYGAAGQRQEYSYREFFEEACRTANFLHSIGIRRGDAVATFSFSHPDVVIQYAAAFLVGAVVVPLGTESDDADLLFALQESGSAILFVRDQFVDRIVPLASRAPALKTVVQAGGRSRNVLPIFQTEIARHAARFVPAREPALEDEALLVYRSTPAGTKRGVLLSQYNLLVNAMHIAEWHRISNDQVMMCSLPLHRTNGIVVTMMAPMYAGSGTVISQEFHPEKFFERIGIERVSLVGAPPPLLRDLLHARLSTEGYKLAHFRHIICGASALTAELAQKFEQTYKLPVIYGYGIPETTSASSFLPIDLTSTERKVWLTRHGVPSIGVPLPVNEMAIHDLQGEDLGEGVRGEIVIRGHSVMKQYRNDPEANASAFAHGWLHSGDEGYYLTDDQGRKFFFTTGRITELTGGTSGRPGIASS